MAQLSSTRWCPTPEQRMILKELFSRGITTPDSFQIQRITAHLSLYGKIHGKNVFYWFQNHKARHRQKLRKKQLPQHQPYMHHCCSFAENIFHPRLAFETNNGSVLDGMMKWTAPIRDGLMMIGTPTFPACCGNRPPKTLQLFPLTSPGLMDRQHDITAESSPS